MGPWLWTSVRSNSTPTVGTFGWVTSWRESTSVDTAPPPSIPREYDAGVHTWPVPMLLMSIVHGVDVLSKSSSCSVAPPPDDNVRSSRISSLK
jgi:hypothetical protein